MVLALCAGCAGSPPATSTLNPPPDMGRGLIGLAFREDVYLRFQRDAMVGLAPLKDAVSRYQAVALPENRPVAFESRGTSGLFLAWIPDEDLAAGADRVTIRLIGHEIRWAEGKVVTSWPADQGPTLSGPIRSGRLTYLGRVERRLIPRKAPADSPVDYRTELAAVPDPEGEGLRGPAQNHPWLLDLRLEPRPE